MKYLKNVLRQQDFKTRFQDGSQTYHGVLCLQLVDLEDGFSFKELSREQGVQLSKFTTKPIELLPTAQTNRSSRTTQKNIGYQLLPFLMPQADNV